MRTDDEGAGWAAGVCGMDACNFFAPLLTVSETLGIILLLRSKRKFSELTGPRWRNW